MRPEEKTQLLGEPREVDIVAIERELASLWKNAAEDPGDGNSAPVIRACALNFVIVTEDDSELEMLAGLVDDVTIEHPARIFLVHIDRLAGQPALDSWISARCTMPVPGGKQVCCEQITLTASGTEIHKIPSIVTSLLVADVPSVLLWKPSLDSNDGILHSLLRVVNKVIIDSSENLTPESSLFEWEKIVVSPGQYATFSDLAWTHLTEWRSLVAGAFNPHEMRAALTDINSVKLEYSSTTTPRHSGMSQALLFVSWLAQKLNWTPLDRLRKSDYGKYHGKFGHSDHSIEVVISPASIGNDSRGGMESVIIQTRGNLTLRFATTGHAECVRFTKHDSASPPDELLTVRRRKSEALLVAEELQVNFRDTGYEAALNTFTHICTLPA
ncbi:MAG: glucose-6-phosphate dehydrogenase assembly protein OpcA [Bacteroidetes bacterium]|nr:glucose-6-phosphate dehydrogenase assembly protein OpcA [Bacteroidota bacterium]MCW5894757.1 glucose-6-phosphate dehydrogenase assembly protein OpcA [Bacteroidota bacterium]